MTYITLCKSKLVWVIKFGSSEIPQFIFKFSKFKTSFKLFHFKFVFGLVIVVWVKNVYFKGKRNQRKRKGKEKRKREEKREKSIETKNKLIKSYGFPDSLVLGSVV